MMYRSSSGYAIPLSLCVGCVALLLGIAATQLAAGDLGSASHLYYQERARQAADFALENYVAGGTGNAGSGELTVTSNGPQPVDIQGGANQSQGVALNGSPVTQLAAVGFPSLSNTHPQDRAALTIYDNTAGNLPADSGCPVAVPAGFQYWVAHGEARENGRTVGTATVGALVRVGQPVGSAGAQVRFLTNRTSFLTEYGAEDQDGNPALMEMVCATNATQRNDVTNEEPLSLAHAVAFDGLARIPASAPDSFVDTSPGSATVNLDRSAGPFNIPDYSPPALLQTYSGHIATNDPAQPALAEGAYARWELDSNTLIRLDGTYHVQELVIRGSDSKLVALDHTRLFVDHVTVTDPHDYLGLQNDTGTAAGLQVHFKPSQQIQSLKLQMELTSGGLSSTALVIAPNFALDVMGDSLMTIKGSFACETLNLDYHGSGSARFIYDVSANANRQSSDNDGGNHSQEHMHTGGTDEDPAPAEGGVNALQPMILSKQDL